MTKLIQLWTQSMEALSSLLALKWSNCNKFCIRNHTVPSCNFPHTLWGCI